MVELEPDDYSLILSWFERTYGKLDVSEISLDAKRTFWKLTFLAEDKLKEIRLENPEKQTQFYEPVGRIFEVRSLISKPYIAVIVSVGMDKQDSKSHNDKVIELQKQMQLTLQDMTRVMNDLFLIKNKLGRLE